MTERIRRGGSQLLLSAAVLACLAPFLAKPLHVDDPMYVWAARHIAVDPADFYGLEVNWHGLVEPMYRANKNPPLVSFYLAAWGRLLGFGEVALHAAMAGVAVVAALGIHALARRFTSRPLLAAGVAGLMPVAVVSATTLMSDVALLALWCWGSTLWVRGLESGRPRDRLAAAAVLALAPLAKYFGLALVPLLFAYSWARERRIGSWAAWLAVPLVAAGAFELWMRARYGVSPLADVARYAPAFEATRARFTPLERALVGLCFTGGCLLSALWLAPLAWSRRALAAGGVLSAAGVALAPALGTLGDLALVDAGGARWDLALHIGVYSVAAFHVLALAVADLRRRRDAESLWLALWLAGVVAFASFANWTPTARALLPAAPAAGILVARRLELRGVRQPGAVAVALVAGAAVSLAVALADARLAESARSAARRVVERHDASRLYFQGAWGFQYYMQELGAERLDRTRTRLEPGALLVTPGTGSNLIHLPPATTRPVDALELPAGRWAATLSKPRGAGFYAALWGPLPFVLGPAPPERYAVDAIVRPVTLRRREGAPGR